MISKNTCIFAIVIALLLFPAIGSGTVFVSVNEAHDIDMAILNDDTGMFVLAWCDDTDDSARYQVLYTNGSAYGSVNSFDTAAGNTCMISVSALNKTAFVIAYGDDGVGTPDWTIAGYDINGNAIITPFDVDADIGTAFDIGVCALNSTRYASVAADANDNDATYVVYNMADQILGQNDTDISIAAGGTSSQKADCSAISNSSWVFTYYDDDPDEIAYAIYSNNGVEIKPRTTIRASSLNGGVSVSGLSNGGFVVFYCEETNQRVAFNTYNSTGSSISGEIVVNTSITGCNGAAETKVEVTALNSTDSRFAVVYDNANTDKSYFAVYNYTGAEILPPKLLATTDISDKAVAIAGYDPVNNRQICKFHAASSPIIVAYNNQSGTNAVWETYFANGSSWNGNCADVTAPSVNIAAPTNSTVGNTSVQLIFTASDAYLDSCVHELDGTNTTITNCSNQTMSGLSAGAHRVRVFANDTANNTNVSSVTFTVDQAAPSINIIAPANSTVGNTSVQLIFTASDSFMDKCTRELDGTNTTITGCSNQTMSGLGTGAHNVAVFANDTVNNTALSRMRFTVDETAPSLTIQSPTNTTFNASSVSLSFTASDPNLGSCWRILDTANASLASCANTTLTGLSTGAHNVTVFANDTTGNTKEASAVYFTVDNSPPSLNLISLANVSVRVESSINFTFNVTDNSAVSLNCSIYIDGSSNQTNASTTNNTNTNFTVAGLAHGTHNWSMNCTDAAGNTNTSAANVFTINRTPTLASISDSPDPIQAGGVIAITASSANDPNNDTLNFYCDTTEAPTAANTDCTGGSTIDTSPPYSLTCAFATPAGASTYTTYCRVYDGETYSTLLNTTYTTDSAGPTTSVVNVSGDASPAYYDTGNDNLTNITISGEASMSCRWSTSDVAYSSMSNGCTISGIYAFCEPITNVQGTDAYNFYISCRDSLNNEQNSSSNLDIISFITDWTSPATSDDSSSSVQLTGYNVTITESDNTDSDPATFYCVNTSDACIPNAAIDNSGKVQFSSRGRYYLRYNSSDDAGNAQSIQSATININQLPVFASAADNAAAIKGGTAVNISAISSDPDSGQTIKLFACKTDSANASGCSNSTNTYCSANATANASCTFSAESDDTSHTWYAFIFDQMNESATANPRSGTYTTDSAAPAIIVNSPANTTLSQNSTTLEIVLNEAGSSAYFCLDSCGSNTAMTNISSTLWTRTMTGLSNGTHIVVIYANDTLGNTGNYTLGFTVDTSLTDTTPPSITVLTPVNNTYYTVTSHVINITSDEPLSSASYSINGTAFQQLFNWTPTNWNKTISLSEGTYSMAISARDNSSNRNERNYSILFFIDEYVPANGTIGYLPASPNDISNVTCFSYWTDGIELSQGFVEHNESGSFSNTTNSTLSGTSGSLNYTINASDVNPGKITCRFHVSDKSGRTRIAETNISVADVTAPNFTDIAYVPNTTAGLDPGTQVNVTINATDNAGVSAVLLQYKPTGNGTWENRTMTGINGNGYNGSFVATGGNWTFRVRINDTGNNENITAEINISALNDNTWLNTTTIPAVKSVVQTDNRTVNLGNITINNTGDFGLNFTITSDKTWITFNGTANTTFEIFVSSAGSAKTFSVFANATGFSVGSFNYTITVNSSSPNATPLQTLPGNLSIQNVAGPLLSVTIETFSSSVSKGKTGVTYSSKVENLGTADAAGVWLAWTLPSELTLASGTLNRSIENLAVGQSATNTITVNVSSANDTNTTMNATAGGSQSSAVVSGKNVTIGSPVTVTQTITETVSSGGGGGSATGVQIFTLDVAAPERVKVERNQEAAFGVVVRNPNRATTIQNLTLSIDGYPQSLIEVAPALIEKMKFNETGMFYVTIRAPRYTNPGEYVLKIKASGTGQNLIQKSVEVVLVVSTLTEEKINISLNGTYQILQGMKGRGLKTGRIEALMGQIREAVEKGNYDFASKLIDDIQAIRDKAFQSRDLLEQVEQKLGQAEFNGLDAPETRRLYDLAKTAFGREDYERAIERASSALLTYNVETSGKTNYLRAVQNYWWLLLMAGMFLAYGAAFGYRKLTLFYMSRTLASLRREEASIADLMETAQKEYFSKGMIASPEYRKTIDKYGKRLAHMQKARERIFARKSAMIHFIDIFKRLNTEDSGIKDLIRTAQANYFEKGSISKSAYDKTMRSLQAERAEIQKSIGIAKIRKTETERSLLYKVFHKLKGAFSIVFVLEEKAEGVFRIRLPMAETGNAAKQAAQPASGALGRMINRMHPMKRHAAKKRFGSYGWGSGWDPQLAKGAFHGLRRVLHSFGPLMMMMIILVIAASFALAGAGPSLAVTGLATGAPAVQEESDNAGIFSASAALDRAQQEIAEMQSLGFGIELANDTLKEARILLKQKNYSGAEAMALKVSSIKQSAIDARSQIDETDAAIYQAGQEGIDVSAAREIFDRAVFAFNIESYLQAHGLISEARSLLEELKGAHAQKLALEKSKAFDPVKFATGNWLYIIIAAIVAVLVAFLIYRRYEAAFARRKIRSLEQEQAALKKAIKGAQRSYFSSGSMTREQYNIAKNKYQLSFVTNRKNILALRKKLAELSGKK